MTDSCQPPHNRSLTGCEPRGVGQGRGTQRVGSLSLSAAWHPKVQFLTTENLGQRGGPPPGGGTLSYPAEWPVRATADDVNRFRLFT